MTWRPSTTWYWLPFDGWRFRITTTAQGAIGLRTYFGFWYDLNFQPNDLPALFIFFGDLLLLALLPARIRAELRDARQLKDKSTRPTSKSS